MNMHLTNSDTIQVAQPKTAEEVLALARQRKSLWSAKTAKPRDQITNENEALRQRVAELTKQVEQLTADNTRLGQEVWRVTVGDSPHRKKASDIIKETLRFYPEFTYEDIIGRRRTLSLIEARHACMYAVYQQRPDMSWPEMGRVFRRDHSSLLSACRKMARKDRFSDKHTKGPDARATD